MADSSRRSTKLCVDETFVGKKFYNHDAKIEGSIRRKLRNTVYKKTVILGFRVNNK
jgi:hypothetical protein